MRVGSRGQPRHGGRLFCRDAQSVEEVDEQVHVASPGARNQTGLLLVEVLSQLGTEAGVLGAEGQNVRNREMAVLGAGVVAHRPATDLFDAELSSGEGAQESAVQNRELSVS
jgi:hypothetical protein